MALDRRSWEQFASDLEIGGKRNEAHDCGEGRKLIISRSEAGYSAWCYRCSDKGFIPAEQPTLAERLARIRSIQRVEDKVVSSIKLPGPFNYDPSTWPLEARVWLYKAGFSNELIVEHKFYYNSKLDRVVMPCQDENGVTYWQARGFNPSFAKYLNPAYDGDKPHPFYNTSASGPLVVSEDLLSAIRVSEIAASCALMGTTVTDRFLRLAISSNREVFVWLDPDDAGYKGRASIVSRLGMLGVRASIIRTDLDPKLYSRAQIKEILGL